MKTIFQIFLTMAVWGTCAIAKSQTMSDLSTNSPVPTHNTMDDYAGKLGVGLTFGEPIGVSAKFWLSDTLALDGAAGWSADDHTDFYLHSDLLWHDFNLIPVSKGRLPVYLGVGVLTRFRESGYSNQVGIRGPLGVSYMFDNAPIDIFAEIGPALDVAPNIRGEITGGIGIRYWF